MYYTGNVSSIPSRGGDSGPGPYIAPNHFFLSVNAFSVNFEED